MRVLVVDDDPNCRQILELMLTRCGWTVCCAENGEEALSAVAGLKPDLVLMDILMPRMTGTEAVRRLKADPALAHIPAIAITALAFEHDCKAALAAGFDMVITKPFSRRQLLEAIERFFPGSCGQPPVKVPA